MKSQRSRCRVLLARLALAATLAALSVCAGEDRIVLEASVNGKPVRLIFDTGASDLILFRQGAERLGLKMTAPPKDVQLSPGEVPVGRTEECEFVLGANHARTAFRVFEPPAFVKMGVDGAVGWQPIRYNLIQIDAIEKRAVWLSAAPPETASWLKFRIRKQSRILSLELSGNTNAPAVLTIDTGSSCGISFSPGRWRTWVAAHANQPTTLMAGYMPGAGTVVTEEMWGKEVALGPLVLTEVPVMPSNVAEQAMGAPGFEAALGLAALKRLDLIVDGNLGIAFLHPRSSPGLAYPHNRLGAVFVPPALEGGDLVARVMDHSPASDAGIRNGDVLLKVGDLDATKWRTDPKVLPLSRFWEQPPGTKLDLLLRRDGKSLKVAPVLRQILGTHER